MAATEMRGTADGHYPCDAAHTTALAQVVRAGGTVLVGELPMLAGTALTFFSLQIAMNNRHLLRGLFLVAISLAFGIGALQYRIGHFERAGPGLFPLMVSCMLLLIGIATIVRSRFMTPRPMEFNYRNIAIILASLCGFAIVSEHLNMIAGIIFMAFCASFAGGHFSFSRNIKVAAGLVAIALMFQKLLGFNLPLY